MGRDKKQGFLHVGLLVVALLHWSPDLSSGDHPRNQMQPISVTANKVSSCDMAVPLTSQERDDLFKVLKDTKTGAVLLSDFVKIYGDIKTLVVQWDAASYSKITHGVDDKRTKNSNTVVCIHLAKRLPDIEHAADLAHELVHATRLSEKTLNGENMGVDEFVQARLAARGGEADAFAVECLLKRELLGRWDDLCSPYARDDEFMDVSRIIDDLYSGQLAASLTGEPYPLMLMKQYRRMVDRKIATATTTSNNP